MQTKFNPTHCLFAGEANIPKPLGVRVPGFKQTRRWIFIDDNRDRRPGILTIIMKDLKENQQK
jgi:hypothetical protein